MFDRSTLERRVTPLVDGGERFGVFLVSTTVMALAVGYAIGGVLAGRTMLSQYWVLVFVGMWVVAIATLYSEPRET